MLSEAIVKGIYQWLFFFFPALTLAGIGFIPTCARQKVTGADVYAGLR